MLDSFINRVRSKFKITQSDSLPKALGFQIERTKTRGVFMLQQSHIRYVLKRFGMENCKAVDTPFDSHIRLCKEGMYNTRTGMSRQATQGESLVHNVNTVQFRKRKKQYKIGTEAEIPFRELIGCLLR